MFNGMSKNLECEKHAIELGFKQIQDAKLSIDKLSQNKGFSIHTKNVVEWLEKSLEIMETQANRIKELERENTLLKATVQAYE